MEPTSELIDALFIDKVMAARQRTFEQKFFAGGELFMAVVERMKMGIRMQNPNATDDDLARELERRFVIARLLERTA